MATTEDAPPIGLGTNLSYGVGALGTGIGLAALSAAVLNYFLNQVVGISPVVVGSLILVSLVVDAVLDPMIGQWSDNLRTRWGRRHPLMYVATGLWGLTFYFLWHAPKGLVGVPLLGFMLALLLAVRISASLYEIPSQALVPELAPNYDQRTGILSIRWFFLIIGLAGTSFVLNAIFLRKDAANPLGALNPEGYAGFGALAAVVILVAGWASALGTHGRIRHLHIPPRRTLGAAATLREMSATLLNPALVILMLCGLFGGVGGGLRTALDTYFYLHFWDLLPQQIGILLPMGVLGSIVAVIIAPILSRRLGKKMTMIVFFTFSTIVSLAPMTLKLMGLMPPNSSPWIMPILIIDSIVVAVLALSGFIIISSMVADVVEDNAVKNGGVRSEGLLFAANGLLPKVTTGIGVFVADQLLSVVRFPAHAIPGTVPMDLMRHLVLLFLPTYSALVALSVGVLVFYRIDREAHESNLEKLRESAALAEAVMERRAEAGVDIGRVI
jgi:glycoside/pentoside/hexuronide:cation symporter, GPH family